MARGLKRPSDNKVPEKIVFVQCAGSRTGPDKYSEGVNYCSKTCCSVTAKQIDRMLAVHTTIKTTVVYYRDMRTYERAIEALYQKLQSSAVEFVNGEVKAVDTCDDGALKLSIDPIIENDR